MVLYGPVGPRGKWVNWVCFFSSSCCKSEQLTDTIGFVSFLAVAANLSS